MGENLISFKNDRFSAFSSGEARFSNVTLALRVPVQSIKLLFTLNVHVFPT